MDIANFKIDPFGVLVGHTWLEVGIILDSINRLGIKRFVEIGVHKGGLTGLLVYTTQHVPGLHSLHVEIDTKIVEPTIRKLFHPLANAQLWFDNAHLPEIVAKVDAWCHEPLPGGPALIYCDGGNKIREFALYAPILRHGDFIAAHDYDYGGYPHAEIAWEHIQKPVQEHGLSPIGFVAPIRITLWRKSLS